jgi:hypothetical protein
VAAGDERACDETLKNTEFNSEFVDTRRRPPCRRQAASMTCRQIRYESEQRINLSNRQLFAANSEYCGPITELTPGAKLSDASMSLAGT